MAATGFTPIQLYYSATTTNVPLAANLAAGELAINTADGKLFYKDSSGTVQTIATTGTAIIGGSNTQVQYNSSGSFAGSANMTFNGTGLTSGYFIPSSSTVPTNGLYLPTTNTLAFSTNTTERMRLDSSGNLGLGVTPSAWNLSGYKALEVGAVGNGIYSGNNDTIITANAYYSAGWKYAANYPATFYEQNAGAHIWKTAASGTAGNAITFTQAMTLDASGNLQIGTSSDSIAKLVLRGLHANNAVLWAGGTDANYTGFAVRPNSASNVTMLSSEWASTTVALSFGLGGTEKMRVASSGTLFVGYTSGNSVTSIEAPSISIGQTGTSSTTAKIRFAPAQSGYNVMGIYNSQSVSGGGLIFNTGDSGTNSSNTSLMILEASGNLGVGTVSPTKRIEVVDNQNTGTGIRISNNNAGTATQSVYELTNGTHTHSLGIAGTGYTTYGVITASSLFLYAGGSRDLAIAADGGGVIKFGTGSSVPERARVTSTGGFSVGTTADPGAGAIYATGNITAYYSDERLKNVSGNIENALDKVNSLSGVYYTNNEVANENGYTSTETQVGVLAQQVKAVLPEIVKAAPFDLDADGNSKSGQDYMTVQYERLVPLLIEAIKELTAKVEALEAK